MATVYNGNCIGLKGNCNGPRGSLLVICYLLLQYVPKHTTGNRRKIPFVKIGVHAYINAY